MKKIISLSLLAILVSTTPFYAQPGQRRHTIIDPSPNQTKIQVAFLLDTSNSMDGLINQAKSRLWNIINTLTQLRYNGLAPNIEISLYEYGNNNISPENNYVRMVLPFTNDLDLVSEKLFSLTTYGGEEYCGAVIRNATTSLNWTMQKNALKFIYIAGNEPFNQGPINFRNSIAQAKQKGIVVNTIYCGNNNEGRRTDWNNGAIAGNGQYFSINSDEQIRYVATPYDQRINELNTELNKTYIGYGSQGTSKKRAQSRQDENAKSISAANQTERTVSKSKAVYSNSSWDLVDRMQEDESAIDNLNEEEMPDEYQGMSKADIKKEVAQKSAERDAINKEIATLAKKRETYISQEQAKNSQATDDLGTAINKSVVEVAEKNGYTFVK